MKNELQPYEAPGIFVTMPLRLCPVLCASVEGTENYIYDDVTEL